MPFFLLALVIGTDTSHMHGFMLLVVFLAVFLIITLGHR